MMGYGYDAYGGYEHQGCNAGGYGRHGNTFVLIVVLFILLIVVGATFYK